MDKKVNISQHIVFTVKAVKTTQILKSAAFVFILLATIHCLPAQQKRKVVFVIADGIPADVIRNVHTPALKRIANEGGIATSFVGGEKGGYSETPTISAAGYNSLLTGTWANKHNVWDNEIAAPNYNYWNIFRFFKTQYPKKTTAVFSIWLDNRTKLIGSKAAAAGNLQPDFYFDGMELDTIKFPHDTAGYFYHLIDQAVIDTAASVIRRNAPDLSWVYLEYTDEIGHRHGNSQQLCHAVELMDDQIQRLWKAIQYRQKNFKEDWQIYITTDHGREDNSYHHGGQSNRERTTWIVTNAKNGNEHFYKESSAITDILPSIAAFMNIKIPKNKLFEIDGISLTGKISATQPTAVLNYDELQISWKPINKTGNAKIWLATTNNFKTGTTDTYQLIKQIPVAAGTAKINVKQIPSEFYKVVIQMPYNTLNRWVINKK